MLRRLSAAGVLAVILLCSLNIEHLSVRTNCRDAAVFVACYIAFVSIFNDFYMPFLVDLSPKQMSAKTFK